MRPLPTTVVGTYPQPEWLVDRKMLGGRLPPRTRALEIWRVNADLLEQAQDDATVVAIRDMERAGIDIITDGEIRRESYSNRFATALEGMDLDNPGIALDRTGHQNPVPRVIGPIRRVRPVEKRDVEFLRANTGRTIKATLPGPFTMSQQAQDDHYRDEEALAMALAAAVNEEVKDLFAAGADVVQLDDAKTDQISLESAQQNVDLGVLKSLSGKTLIVGVIDLADSSAVEHEDVVVNRIKNALRFVDPERLIVAPDCGMKYLPRDRAFGKLRVLAAAAARVRAEV